MRLDVRQKLRYEKIIEYSMLLKQLLLEKHQLIFISILVDFILFNKLNHAMDQKMQLIHGYTLEKTSNGKIYSVVQLRT